MSESLFKIFDEVSSKQWKQKIQYDLKGADYNETLVWQSPEGIHVKPFYHPDEFSGEFEPIPGQPASWNITQQIFVDDEAIANKIAVDAVDRGAEAIIFSSEKEFSSEKLFLDFPYDQCNIYFELNFLSEAFILSLNDFLADKKATVYYNLDPIGHLARTGNWFHNLKTDHDILGKLWAKMPTKNLLSVDTTIYQNAGANMVQQLAYALAHANEYLNHFTTELDSGQVPPVSIHFKLAVGSNYFFEIAKIRSLRKLFSVLAEEYNVDTVCHIVCIPSKRNKTLYDYNVNMLRTTTETMSAALGGANSICSLPYDAVYHKSNEFGERIARNQLLILKSESYFDLVTNPSDGAYYIESLTDELSEKALQLFKNIEAGGGFLQQLKEGIIQKKIKESAAREQQQFDSGELKLLGTNYHINKSDLMKQELELYPFVKSKPRKTLIQPIIEKRLAETQEQQRLKTEEA
ncbi:methylmalonyl-CoA mutase subunit beta [Constantimarinum furrinae]|uniref:Methylmalonyl-CoA mutase n=1 Tax=Constantimarinum furrinae TaxID=2562285 RepID=A0A7G8PVP7_9FLAO|nr:methylmalonyl-CoA mutase subunit beta [Constantimarinum furrinae]QNJ98413.1 Methylmalonyl-CoA mutase [Constantimarinum furrinae]